MSKVIRFKDDGSYSLLDMKTFSKFVLSKRTSHTEEYFKYVWRSKVYKSLWFTTDSQAHQQIKLISLSELPEFVRALIVIYDI
ncbi:hypothetical protein HWA94_gp78 [Pseudomonas phage ZC08]|uniref:Uncharacterized protein n=1 Tax=Pseudomonas phage ZC08 TaxID=1622116 RepID=A0A1L2C9E3_9CAUD|nr:hypothetical protein HWA94_gp78 [Pseudomonas phage ZC08]AMD43517.1 hypothetical protein ZC08_048 [Pseudomonas phage ZC08]